MGLKLLKIAKFVNIIKSYRCEVGKHGMFQELSSKERERERCYRTRRTLHPLVGCADCRSVLQAMCGLEQLSLDRHDGAEIISQNVCYLKVQGSKLDANRKSVRSKTGILLL